RDPRLPVLEDGLASAMGDEILVAGEPTHVGHQKERGLASDDHAPVGHDRRGRAGRELRLAQELLNALQEEVEGKHAPELPLWRAHRSVDAHHDVGPDPRGGAHEWIRGGRGTLEPLLVADHQALALAQWRDRRHGDAELVEQDRPVDVRKGLLETPRLDLAGRGAGPARSQQVRGSNKRLDAGPEVLLYLGAQ